MATPLGPKPADSPVTESLPDAHGQAAGENASRLPPSPPGKPLPVGKPLRPWPTTETPLAQIPGETAVTVPPTDDWEEPATDAWEQMMRAREQETGTDPADSSPPFLRRRSLYKRSESPPSAQEQLSEVIDFLQRLQNNIRSRPAEAEASSAATAGLTPLQARRLSRTGVAPDHFEVGALPKPPRVEIAPPVETDRAPGAPEAAEPKEVLPPPEPVRLERRHVVWLILTGGLCLVTLGLVAYLWMRIDPLARGNATPRNPVVRGTPDRARGAEVSEEALNLANLALEAIQRGDFKKASDLFATARKQGVVLPGLSYQAALLAFNQGEAADADHSLEQSISANEQVADCWYLRANSIFFTEGPEQAAAAFEQAIHADPFSPRSYFFRAECLRRNGNATAALAQFQQALHCRPNSTDTELIVFKIGLTKLEANSDLIFKTELHDRLSQEPVPGDTLLLLAADAISRDEFSEAADFLKRAALILPPRNFQSRVRDYVFQAQVKQPDIAAVLKSALPAAAPVQAARRSARVLIDPATRSLAEADPGGW